MKFFHEHPERINKNKIKSVHFFMRFLARRLRPGLSSEMMSRLIIPPAMPGSKAYHIIKVYSRKLDYQAAI